MTCIDNELIGEVDVDFVVCNNALWFCQLFLCCCRLIQQCVSFSHIRKVFLNALCAPFVIHLGSIPRELGQLDELAGLYLDRNQLTGP